MSKNPAEYAQTRTFPFFTRSSSKIPFSYSSSFARKRLAARSLGVSVLIGTAQRWFDVAYNFQNVGCYHGVSIHHILYSPAVRVLKFRDLACLGNQIV